MRDLPGYPWAPLVFILFTLLFPGLAAVANPWEMLAAVLTIASALVVYALFGRNHRIQGSGVGQNTLQDMAKVFTVGLFESGLRCKLLCQFRR